ncbi:MAG: hypothetical protein AAB785_02795 [Patescibacteria group bacterium]
MGTQKAVKKFELENDIQKEGILGSPIAKHHGKKKEKEKTKKIKLEEKIKEKKFEEKKEVEEKVETKTVGEETEKPIKKVKTGKAKIRSKKYQATFKSLDRNKKYPPEEAIELVKKTSISKFDGTVEIHIRLISRSVKPEQVRGILQYPHPTGKKISVVILDDKTIKEIAASKKTEADIYLATPDLMSEVAKLAKILGPKGKMPNPKAGTITEKPQETAKSLASGQVEYKTDAYGIIHQVIGKVSDEQKKLEENYRALVSNLPAEKNFSITVCSTMGPGIKVRT